LLVLLLLSAPFEDAHLARGSARFQNVFPKGDPAVRSLSQRVEQERDLTQCRVDFRPRYCDFFSDCRRLPRIADAAAIVCVVVVGSVLVLLWSNVVGSSSSSMGSVIFSLR